MQTPESETPGLLPQTPVDSSGVGSTPHSKWRQEHIARIANECAQREKAKRGPSNPKQPNPQVLRRYKQAPPNHPRHPDDYRWLKSRQCFWCNQVVNYNPVRQSDPNAATRDHLIPKTFGGTRHKTNIVVSCRRCNNLRGHNIDWRPETAARQQFHYELSELG